MYSRYGDFDKLKFNLESLNGTEHFEIPERVYQDNTKTYLRGTG
jgi:hypothetical protein